MDAGDAARPGLARAVAAAGVDWLQLRDRRRSASELLAAADRLRADAPAARLLVNRRADVAWAAGADGVHL
ncbi:MAG: thiamine phosphate synthase, partial [Myxococcota bacterium]